MWTSRTRAGALLVVVLTAGAAAWFAFARARARDPDEPPPPPAHVEVATDSYALLVGCTEYPVLRDSNTPAFYESNIRLVGPGHDVVSMRSVLRRYLGVPDDHIRVLTGWPDDPAARPTRANILAHLDRLAREVPRGAHVLFLFSGHGSQQPDEPNGDEDDGMDEILLPADAGAWDPKARGVANAIVDDEIHARLLALRDAGAQVWAVFDCCHSGTMMRGVDSDAVPDAAGDVGAPEAVRMRGLSTELLGIPASEIPASSGRGLESGHGLLTDRDVSAPGIAVISAAYSSEQAPEMVLPRRRSAKGRESHGLCTFQVVRALELYGGSLTVGELFEHVRAGYASTPWDEARPLAEGDLAMRVTSGGAGGASLLLLRREGGRVVLDAGSLRGLTVGSVVEVYRSGRFGDAGALRGRLRLTEVEPLYSTCGPVPGGLDPADVPDASPCRIVEVAPGGPPLRLALADATGGHLPLARARRSPLASLLDARTRAECPLADLADADWTLRALATGPDGVRRFVLGPAKPASGLEAIEVEADALAATLARVRWAHTLRGWAASGGRLRLPAGVTVEGSFRRRGEDAEQPLRPGTALLPGDALLVRVASGPGRDVDVALKCLDSTQTETLVTLPGNEVTHRFTREASLPLTIEDGLQVSDSGIGRESLVLIVAVRAPGEQTMDVGRLSAAGPAASAVGWAERQAEHLVLDGMVSADEKARGIEPGPTEAVGVHELAWTTTWGRFSVPPALLEGTAALDAPAVIVPGGAAGAAPPIGKVTWRRAGVVPGDDATADVLLLVGEGESPAEHAIGLLLDENHDAGLVTANPVDAARRAAAGQLPVELMVVVLGPGRAWAAYPRSPGDLALGHVRLASASSNPDRAARRFDLSPRGWAARDTCGPWLSTSFVPFGGADTDGPRSHVIAALRRFFGPR